MPRTNDNEVDILIGRKIHGIRIELGLSRQELAEKIGVTHQQLQKYEKASNRVSGGRLAAIAKATNQKISWFFEETEEAISSPQERMCLEISRNVRKIKSPEMLQGANLLIRSMVGK